MLLLLLACVSGPPDPQPPGTTQHGDTSDTGVTVAPDEDADQDGFLHWSLVDDPALADCDDDDPAVTPASRRLVAPGWFTRGEDTPDDLPFQDAEPIRSINLSGYCIDRTEVTNTRFVAFLETRRAAGVPNADDQGQVLYDFVDDDDAVPERILDTEPYGIMAGYDDHPVTEVYHWSGEAYCDWVEGRLPTEAEWEKAARGAQDARTYPWGDEYPDCERANIRLGREAERRDPCVDDTTPVGTYSTGVSPYGLVDMTGNVAEWVHDWYQPDYYDGSVDTDPQGPPDGWIVMTDGSDFEARVSRGGSFSASVETTTVSARYIEPVDATSNGVGFRCVYDL